MIEDLELKDDARRGPRLLAAGAAVILGAATLAACGDSSDDAAKGSATTAKATTTAAAKPAASSSAPAQGAPKVSPQVKAWIDAGTPRLAAIRIGTPGTITVEPKGNVDNWDHYYPKGTVVTITAKNTKTARFAEWAGACVGKQRVCKVTMSEYKRLIGGFNLDAKAAKGLPKDDPALKIDTGSPAGE